MGYTGDKKREYDLAWKKKRRLDWIKENGPCTDCGEWKEDLEVDHVDASTKLIQPTKLWGMSLTKS